MTRDTLDITLTTTYQSLGAGPMLVQLKTGSIAKVRAASSPPVGDEPGQYLRRRGGPGHWDYTGTNTLYARKSNGSDNQNIELTYMGT